MVPTARPMGGGGGGGGGAWGHVPPQKLSVPPPQKKNHAYIFFLFANIALVYKYFAPHKYHAYSFLKYYALKC